VSYTRQNILRGLVIYSAGDSVAALILGELSLYRMLGIMFVGSAVYALEIPHYFGWIDRRFAQSQNLRTSIARAGLAILYFNPLWIARHLFFIKLFSGLWQEIGWNLLALGLWSFLANIPISGIANYLIQNQLPLKWRFFGSATFSAMMAIYYALSERIFG
jgi:hypothetical protein